MFGAAFAQLCLGAGRSHAVYSCLIRERVPFGGDFGHGCGPAVVGGDAGVAVVLDVAVVEGLDGAAG